MQSVSFRHISLVIVLLAAVMVVSGCTAMDIFQINKPVTKVGTRDILTIENIRTISPSPVFPDELVTLEFIINNLDDTKTADGVYVDLYDPAFMTCTKAGTNGACLPKEDRCSATAPCSILPLGNEPITYELRSPKEEQIANIDSTAKLSFRVLYQSVGSSTMDLVVANYDEIQRAQRAGQSMAATASRSLGSGPVELQMDLMNRDYALSGKSATIKLQVVDLGSHGGSIVNSVIPAGDLVIDFSQLSSSNIVPGGIVSDAGLAGPDDTGNVGDTGIAGVAGAVVDSVDFNKVMTGLAIGDYIDTAKDVWNIVDNVINSGSSGTNGATGATGSSGQSGSTGNPGYTATSEVFFECNKQITINNAVFSTYGCTNIKEIKLINGKSPNIIIRIDNLPAVPIYRTFNIKAMVRYTYELRDGINIEVKPYGS